MTTQRRITRPGPYDNEFMAVTCTPDKTDVEFFEFQGEAEEVARNNLVPGCTTYVGKVIRQGEHAVRGTARHIALLVEVDDELRRALLREFGARSRSSQASAIDGMLRGALAALCRVTDNEATLPESPAAMKKTISPAEKAGDFDGMLRAYSDRYEDFDPRGGFIRQQALTEVQWPEYKAAYERGYMAALRFRQNGRAP